MPDNNGQNTSTVEINFKLNSKATRLQAHPHQRLSDCLRGACNRTDVKVGCNAGDCGACSVLLDGKAVCSCLVPVSEVNNRQVDTVSGLVESDAVAQKVADAFIRYGAVQCGICTPGMLVSATTLLKQISHPTETQVADALGGVLCRCTGYRKIIDAVVNANNIDTARNSDESFHAVSDREALLSFGNMGSELKPVKGGVGASLKRVDAREKVNGTDIFGDDGAPVDALRCFIVRSPHHHAGFVFGDMDEYLQKYSGIKRIITAKDVPGENCFGVIPPFEDQPIFAVEAARFKGEAVAAIICIDSQLTSKAINAFPIEWQERDAHLSMDDALSVGAVELHDNRAGNIMCRGVVKKGDVESGFAAGSVEVSGEYQTDFIEHAYIEPEAGYAVCTKY